MLGFANFQNQRDRSPVVTLYFCVFVIVFVVVWSYFCGCVFAFVIVLLWWCGGVFAVSVVVLLRREALEKSVEEDCCKEVLEKSVVL